MDERGDVPLRSGVSDSTSEKQEGPAADAQKQEEPEPITPLALEAFALLDRDADGFLSASDFGVFALLCGGGVAMDIEAMRLEVWSVLDVPEPGLSPTKWLRLVLRGIPTRRSTAPSKFAT